MLRRRFRQPSIWREMDRLQREMNRLFESSLGESARRAPRFPAMNVWASDEEQVVTAEVPGMNPKDINVNVSGDMMTIEGVRQAEEYLEDVRYHRRERGTGDFKRTIQLPFPVDADKVEAKFKNGVITIRLPRAEADKPKRITIKSG